MNKANYTLLGFISVFSASTLAESSAIDTLINSPALSLTRHAADLALFWQKPVNSILPRAAISYYRNTDKAVIQALYGQWQVTFLTPQAVTGTLNVSTTLEDTNFGYYGWDSKNSISCFYEPNIFGSPYSYQCLHITNSSTGIAQRFLFNIQDNRLTGKYHSGTAADFIAKLNANQLSELSGSNPSKISDPVFNENTGELAIPKVLAGNKAYRVIMKREANGQFSLKSAQALTP